MLADAVRNVKRSMKPNNAGEYHMNNQSAIDELANLEYLIRDGLTLTEEERMQVVAIAEQIIKGVSR